MFVYVWHWMQSVQNSNRQYYFGFVWNRINMFSLQLTSVLFNFWFGWNIVRLFTMCHTYGWYVCILYLNFWTLQIVQFPSKSMSLNVVVLFALYFKPNTPSLVYKVSTFSILYIYFNQQHLLVFDCDMHLSLSLSLSLSLALLEIQALI